MRCAAKTWAGAVGLVVVWCSAPFEECGSAGQGRSALALYGLVVVAIAVIVLMIFVSIRRLLARGSGAMHRSSSLKTMFVCSFGETVGRLQCVGYSSKVAVMRMARVSGT